MSLFETLVALAILALVLAVAAGGLSPRGSDADLRRISADVVAAAGTIRSRAIATGETQVFRVDELDCARRLVVETRFFFDGSARGPDLCLAAGDRTLRLTLDPLTGLYEVER